MTAEQAYVARDGLWLPPECTEVVDVLLGEHRVFTGVPTRYEVDEATGLRLVPWPGVLRPHLTGHTHVLVRSHVSEETWIDADFAFDDTDAETSVRDPEGYPLAVDKWHFLVRTFDSSDPELGWHLLGDLTRLLRLMNDDLGVPAFIAYGTLLGAVRSGHFIGHDNDADIAYVSHHEHPADIVRESFRIERGLISNGWRVNRSTGGFLRVWADDGEDAQRKIDVFTGYFVGDQFAIERWVCAPLARESLLPLSTVTLEDTEFPAPARPEDLLAATYGEEWRIPDPAFTFRVVREIEQRSSAWFGEYWLNQWRWSARAVEHGGGGEPSSFARWVEPQLGGGPLTDIGCGTGADAVWLGRDGRDVVGLDYADEAITLAAEAARQTGSAARFEALSLLDLRACLTTGARLALRDRGRGSAMARGLVEVLTGEGRRHLWLLCRILLGGGGRLFLELPEPDEVASEMLDNAGRIVSQEWVSEGDERVCRMVVAWDETAAVPA
jgi:SAM-dependent methyltransferase